MFERFAIFNKIRWRLAFAYVALLTVALGLLGLYLLQKLETFAIEQLKESMKQNAALIAQLLNTYSPEDTELWQDIIYSIDQSLFDARVTIIRSDGKVIVDSWATNVAAMENHRYRPEIIQAREDGFGQAQRYSTSLGTTMVYVALPMIQEHSFSGYIRVALPRDEIDSVIHTLRQFVYFSLGITILGTTLLSIFLSARLTKPLFQISKTAERISQGDLGQTISVNTTQEINSLADSFNRMSLDLEHKIHSITEREIQLNAIITTIISGLLLIDDEGFIQLANPAAQDLFNMGSVTWQRRFQSAVRNSELEALIEEVLATGHKITEEITLYTDEAPRIMQVYVAPVAVLPRDDKPCQMTSGVVVVLFDMTDIRMVEKSRRELIANVSHELRTPVTAIKGFTETLLAGALDEDDVRESFLKIIDQETGRLQHLIDDLMQLARLEAGQLCFNLARIDLTELITHTVHNFDNRFKEKGMHLMFQSCTLPPILADRARLEQVFANILENVLQHAVVKATQVMIKVEVVEKYAIVSISDDGPGILASDQPHVFERFFRTDKSRARQSGGTGLGLAIVKHLVEHMNGTVTLSSFPGKGTTVIIRLPLAN